MFEIIQVHSTRGPRMLDSSLFLFYCHFHKIFHFFFQRFTCFIIFDTKEKKEKKIEKKKI